MTLTLGVPSKGRLMEQTYAWFGARGIEMQSVGHDREYVAASGFDGLQIALLSAGEIPRELAAGRIHLGVTGLDVVRERLADWEAEVEALSALGFGHADLVIAVPTFWVDVTTLEDLDAAAAAFRRAHGSRLRIATKYHRLVREFLRDQGVADYQLVDSQGATEATVRNQAAEAVADITTTGETLRVNHLRPLDDGLILKSQATLFRSRSANWNAEAGASARGLCERLELDPPDWLLA